MKNKGLNYYQTFIMVSPDCPVSEGTPPPVRKGGTTKPRIEYELLSNNPYTYTQEDLIYEVHVRHKSIPKEERMERGTKIKDKLFQKPQPCLRASMLPKKYGWGLHFDEEGKIALYGQESLEYSNFLKNEDGKLKLLPAMRNSRARE
ncbi:hypothetical protein AM501_01405 [Aneurinibacillus migulanus]|uniref:Uncharacterized protein n=1 Tax=Aneurinibacillus migulanus TaxID=47500 RepID=A0A0D1Y4D1_ANEMI|nr:DUF6157 family protein [Aneurinibacillus migulanus]KIV54097.1 hypothetical protein TS65_19335 [Aneurinibacillus migulanus]KON97630.1 hypothetical protein AF333_21465 [Aneurinibacillus migulanus]KPD09953.1 hypothetical protein AM501_01405 [Aneurinibacillus migulanus]MED0894375.1 DUF6157 family protein [Aneurinibacillus migulanus]MED1616985.1 DUF6157 family protein [Aneurinibacillus migulanus]